MTREEQDESIHAPTKRRAIIMAIAPMLAIALIGYAACAVGSLLHEPGSGGASSSVAASTTQQYSVPPASMNGGAGQQQLSPEERKAAADKEAGPLVEQLASHPKNAALAAQIGNLYYDAHVFFLATKYYQRSLSIDADNLAVRTDLATALFADGDVSHALAELNRVLQRDPSNNAALFNRGIVKWQGERDVDGAVADWESILRQNPNYAQGDKIRAIIALARKHSS